MAFDEGLAARIRQLTMDLPTITEKKMFGGIAFMIHDYMFVGVQNDDLMARVFGDDIQVRSRGAKVPRNGRDLRECRGSCSIPGTNPRAEPRHFLTQ